MGKKNKKKNKGPKKALCLNGWYLCRSKKVIFGIRMKGSRIDFSNYVEFPLGMTWTDAKKKMKKKKITWEHRPQDEPPF